MSGRGNAEQALPEDKVVSTSTSTRKGKRAGAQSPLLCFSFLVLITSVDQLRMSFVAVKNENNAIASSFQEKRKKKKRNEYGSNVCPWLTPVLRGFKNVSSHSEVTWC